MKVGIVVYSKSGSTFEIANKIGAKFDNMGFAVDILRVDAHEEKIGRDTEVSLQNSPAIDNYDILVFGAPVHAFSLAEGMKKYLNQLSSVQNKKICCFVTKKLPFRWTGGFQALAVMESILKTKGGALLSKEIFFQTPKDKSDNKKKIENFCSLN